MKELISKFVLLLVDIVVIIISILFGFLLRKYLGNNFNLSEFNHTLNQYFTLFPIYMIIILIFFYEGIYTNRYDFWHETFLISKSIILSSLIVFSLLALLKTIDNYSRFILVCSFFLAIVIIPISKLIVKYILFKVGIWKKEVFVIGDRKDIKDIIINNFYLGYIETENNKKTDICIINSNNKLNIKEIAEIIDNEISNNKDVMFVPFLNHYNLSTAEIFEIFEKRYNIILLKNRLKSKMNVLIKVVFNYLLALCLMPILLPLIVVFAFLIKIESKGPVFFKQKRIGKNCKPFYIYKFRSMYKNADKILEELLEKNEELRKEWEQNHKLKNDPRITKIGKFLRKTSLDELPQIFNVLKGDMAFVGPRPVTEEELNKFYKENKKFYCMVKPGITGLWQVSGRNDISYEERVQIDKWYVINWSLWLDVIILIKTFKAIFTQKGVY